LKELLAIMESCRAAPGEAGELATLVRTEGSSYRRVGARLLWRPDGGRLGSISGGCLEEDLLLRAAEVHRSGRGELVVYDTTSENDLVWGVGLGCHGVVRLTLEPVVGLPLPYAHLQAAWERRRPAVLATAFSGQTGAVAVPQVNAAVCLMEKDGEMWSSGSVDAASAAEAAERCFASASNHYTEAQIEGAGRVDIFWEYLPPPMTLHIFGAGDDAQPLCRLARELGWRVFVRDPRAAFSTAARVPGATHVSS
jgi:xanthine/CO dehydrogenase XdhC/CoxF family maturation factor